jgi:hypothetical protein
MSTVLLYAAGPQTRNTLAALSDFLVLETRSPAELARRLVGEPDILCLVLQSGLQLPEGFLESLQASFPVLPVFLVPDGPSAGELADLAARIASLRRQERRQNPRFDWPLRGSLSLPGAEPETYDLRALSASGAFLQCPGPCLPAGSRGRLRVQFRNFSLETGCEVLDTRRASSNLPDGFGVRFTGLSEDAQAHLDRIVRDALVRALLEPESEPELPSLGDGELLPGGFQFL